MSTGLLKALGNRTPGTDRMPSGSCNVSECEFPKEVDIIYGRGTGRLYAPSMCAKGLAVQALAVANIVFAPA